MLTFTLSSVPLFSQLTTDTYNYTGAPEYWVVPPCVTSIDIVLAGASGGGIIGDAQGGDGAIVTGTLAVTPGDVIEIIVGGQGTCPGSGYPGGGTGWVSSDGNPDYASCGGGGHTQLSIGATLMGVAGAGGGAGGGSDNFNNGGDGGCAAGVNGVNTFGDGGGGGTSTTGGIGGAPWAGTPPGGADGGYLFGGDGGDWQTASGGGGGSGYYGGGGGGNDGCCTGANGGGGGGGGSSLIPTGGGCTGGLNVGDGYATITYILATPPAVDAGTDTTVCDGESITLTAFNPDGATITWDGGVTDGVSFVPPLGTTVYTVTATDPLTGCDSTDQVTITVNPYPIVDAGPDFEVCDGDMATLTADNPDGAIISWDMGVVDGVPFLPTGTSLYTVTADLLGCLSTDNVTITVNPLPIVSAGPDTTICEGQSVTLYGSGATSYTWDNGVTDGVPFSVPTTTTYTVTGTDDNGCQNTDAMTVTTISNPAVSFTADVLTGCEPLNVTFTNLSSPTGSNCYWDFGNGNTATGCGTVSHTYMHSGVYNVSLRVVLPGGCEATETYNSYIEVIEPPIAAFSVSDPTVDINNTDIEFVNTSLYANTYTWIFGDGSPISNVENPSHTFPDDPNTSYNVILYAENYLGCTDSTYKTIIVDDVILFYIPNAFTPGDELNTTFIPIVFSGVDIHSYHFTVFNRWGEIIFESYNPAGGWDGTYGSQGLVQEGVYVWQLEFLETMSDKRHKHRGHVTILK